MKNPSLLLIALCFLGVAMLGCLGGIIGLAWQGDRPIPDVLIGTTGTIVGAFGTLLVGTLGRTMDAPVRRRNEGGYVSLSSSEHLTVTIPGGGKPVEVRGTTAGSGRMRM